MKEKKIKKEIGRVDKADFPLLKLENIDIKIDTGAFTSSIHCKNVIVENNYLKCTFLDEEHPSYHEKEFIFDAYDVRVVRSSNGETQTRYRILTEIILFNQTYPIFLTLSDRGEMKYPVLIGRKFLNKKFVVDINATNKSYKLKTKVASN
ncbi:ATP-dependent zinc protease family protein [Patiriisocius marinistellae]|nr:RimK/LysX family protein [Patiriisocius marinistellae]